MTFFTVSLIGVSGTEVFQYTTAHSALAKAFEPRDFVGDPKTVTITDPRGFDVTDELFKVLAATGGDSSFGAPIDRRAERSSP